MTATKLFFLFVFSGLNASSFAQEGKFIFIKDKDTLKSIEAKVFLEVSNELFLFSNKEHLVYNEKINPDSINSVVVVYQNDTLSFNNIREQVKYSHLPMEIIKATSPKYKNLFEEKTNLYFTVDAYPFETKDRKKLAEENKSLKLPLTKIIIADLQFPDEDMMIYIPGKSSFRQSNMP